MIVDQNSQNAVLIHYRGGAYGNFIFHILSEFFSNTVKVDNRSFNFSSTGNSHNTKTYIETYNLAGEIEKKTLQSYSDYKYSPEITDHDAVDQIKQGKKFLIRCDTSVVDNYKYLLSQWQNAQMIRMHQPEFIDRLVIFSNLMHKSAIEKFSLYKNCLFDPPTVERIRSLPGDFEENLVDAMVETFQKNFDIYGKTFVKHVDHARVYNFSVRNLENWDIFYKTIKGCCEFLGAHITDVSLLENCYRSFVSHQHNLKYYSFDKNTCADDDDLIGRALVKYYQLTWNKNSEH